MYLTIYLAYIFQPLFNDLISSNLALRIKSSCLYIQYIEKKWSLLLYFIIRY